MREPVEFSEQGPVLQVNARVKYNEALCQSAS
jgi:hypothetical protein